MKYIETHRDDKISEQDLKNVITTLTQNNQNIEIVHVIQKTNPKKIVN